MIIGLGNPEDAKPGTMLHMLDVLFSGSISVKEKMDLLENQCGIPMKSEKSISVLVKSLSEAGIGEDFIAEKISENYDLTVEQATRKVEKYRPIPA